MSKMGSGTVAHQIVAVKIFDCPGPNPTRAKCQADLLSQHHFAKDVISDFEAVWRHVQIVGHDHQLSDR